MGNVYIEPHPKGREEGEKIDYYMIEHDHGVSVDGKQYATQHEAIEAAKAMGHKPLVTRVRHTDKGNPGHWRSAD